MRMCSRISSILINYRRAAGAFAAQQVTHFFSLPSAPFSFLFFSSFLFQTVADEIVKAELERERGNDRPAQGET